MTLQSIAALITELRDIYSLTPVIGLELEWTLRHMQSDGQPAIDDTTRRAYLDTFREVYTHDILHSVDVEDGAGQVEAALHATSDIETLLQQSKSLKTIAAHIAGNMHCVADFSAKPFANDYGNGLHVHLHLEDASGQTVFSKNEGEPSRELRQSIAGLLHGLPDAMPVFMGDDPTAPARYVAGFNAPVNVSWGMNNRTTALRLPDNTTTAMGLDDILIQPRSQAKRIEHRVACASTNVAAVITNILQSVIDGLHHDYPCPQPIYGDASDLQYASLALPLLPDSKPKKTL